MRLNKSYITVILYLSFLVLLVGCEQTQENKKGITTSEPAETQIVQEQKSATNLVSHSFEDFKIICNKDATSLQKEEDFKKFKDKYVAWAGMVSYISESLGKYSLQVRHCPSTLTSDIIITMKDNQKEKLLKL